MPLLKIDESCIIGTEYIVEANYYNGAPVAVLVGQPEPKPDPEKATLTILLTSGSKIQLNGQPALLMWDQLCALAHERNNG